MSRELLKRAAVVLHDHFDGVNWVEPLLNDIDNELAQPNPEPVAWMVENHSANDTFVNFTPNFNSHFEKLCCKVTPLYIALPDQSAEIAALKHELQQADEDYVAVEEAYLQCQKDLYDETEKLAALQAREPMLLDDADIDDMCDSKAGENGCSYDFARAIEQAVLRNNGFKVEE